MTNITGISLPLAVWLAADDYDFNPKDRAISATALLKPSRQILLRERIPPEEAPSIDVADRIASRLGHAIHDSIEKAWVTDYKTAMLQLGYPQNIIDKVVINPTPAQAKGDIIPVYLEQRASRTIMGFRISGKFDQSVDGELNDTKSTSVFSYMSGDKDEDYSLQGSIYRWIHHDKITSDYIQINFVFTDWQRAMAKANSDYPQQRVISKRIPLLSLKETETWIMTKLRHLQDHADLPEQQLPRCTDKDLWRSGPVWKYYSTQAAADAGGRSQKNFEDPALARAHVAEKGKGVIVEVPGKARACAYCQAAILCTQKDEYEHA
jgi:hypothetical protein